MCNKVLPYLIFVFVVSCTWYAYCCTHQKSSITLVHGIVSSKVMRHKALCFSARYCCCLGAVAPLLLLLFSTVMCACTAVMVSLAVVISRDFESQLKSSGHATHSHSF